MRKSAHGGFPNAPWFDFNIDIAPIEDERAASRRARALTLCLTYSAGLASFCDRRSVVDSYDLIWAEHQQRRDALAQLCEDNRALTLQGLDDLLDVTLTERSGGGLFAVSLCGPFAAAVALIALQHVKVATVFRQVNITQKRLLEAAGVVLVDLNRHRTARTLFQECEELCRDAYILFLLIESAAHSRRHYNFMGYRVACSSLIEMLAARTGREVSRVVVTLEDRVVRLHVSRASRGATTEALLAWAEEQAGANRGQYVWAPSSIIFSDPTAFGTGLTFLPDILAWRERALRSNRRDKKTAALGQIASPR